MNAFTNKSNFVHETICNDLKKAEINTTFLNQSDISILEYGCGDGCIAYRFALEHPNAKVLGVDISKAYKGIEQRAQKGLGNHIPPSTLSFQNLVKSGKREGYQLASDDVDVDAVLNKKYDFIYSWCVFEHIDNRLLENVAVAIRKSLSDQGLFYFMVNPLYFSEWGSHLNSWINKPWAHLEVEVAYLREQLRQKLNNGAAPFDHVWEQYETLNMMTANCFQLLFERVGLKVLYDDRVYSGKPGERLLRKYNVDALRTKQITMILKLED